jgi:hypothetical protein
MHSRMIWNPAPKAGPSDIHSVGERVAQTFQSPGQQMPEHEIYDTEKLPPQDHP